METNNISPKWVDGNRHEEESVTFPLPGLGLETLCGRRDRRESFAENQAIWVFYAKT